MNALDYFLKANLYGLLFVGCYWLLLRRHTFFQLNRFYLLLSAVLTLTLPLASLPQQTVETLPRLELPVPISVVIPAAPVATVTQMPVDTAPVTAQPNWEPLGLLAYSLIALVLVVLFLVRLGRLHRLIRKAPQQGEKGYTLIQPNDPTIPTFSFFRYLVLNPADAQNELIKAHELVHIRQHHSADVLTMTLLRAIFWACPSLWLTDWLLREVHEFLADKESHRPADYARFLVEYTFGVKPDTLVNGFFNPSLLRQRIRMLHQKATTRWALGKYALVLPLLLGLLAMTTAREELADVMHQATDETVTVSGRVTSSADGKPLPGAIVMVASTGKGTPTDVQGRYTLKNVSKTAVLSISFVGFTTMVIPVNGRTVIHAALSLTEPNELPTMGATAAYRAIKPNPDMPIRTPPSSETVNGRVLTAVEESAVFPTGIPGLMQYVAHTLRYPAKAKAAGIQGNVFVQFTVLSTGAIGSATIKKGIGSGCDEEALRIVRQMPRWLPAKQNSKFVASNYVLPIQFALEKTEDKRTGQLQSNQLSDVYVTAYEPPVQMTPAKPTSQTARTGDVFTVVEQVPEFRGGMKALGQYLSKNLRYPSEARQNHIQGRVYVQFVVSPTGEIQNLRVRKGIGGGCDEEAVRVISQMPRWNPGYQQGNAVAVQYNLAVQFSLEKAEDKRTGQVVTPQPDSSKKVSFMIDNNRNGRFALYNDVVPDRKERYALRLPDSLSLLKSDRPLRMHNLSDKSPLYILDGIVVPANTLKAINPNDIERINVLKNPAAAYGAKDVNGVVIITTKKK